MSTLSRSDLNQPLDDHQQLCDYLAQGARAPSHWGIGAESEKLVIDRATGEAASAGTIATLMETLAGRGRWREVRENGYLLALFGEHSSVTLEPGGQIELSGRLCPNIHCCVSDLTDHIRLARSAADPNGLSFLGLGAQPYTALEDIAWLPKRRYGIMGPYMARTGSLGQAMMKQTAGLQVNLDFSDEQDCIAKLQLSFWLAPLLYALFANSPIMEGRPTGFLSTRGEIWAQTDPDRTGLIHALFEDGAGYGTYVDYALDVPMYFIIRDGEFIDFTRERVTFRRYLSEGYADQRAELRDWDLHLSTLFPEARLRPQIEVRSADSLPPHLVPAVAALLKGVFYDADALAACRELFSDLSQDALESLYRLSWRQGLQSRMGARSLHEVAREVVAISRAGLQRQRRLNNQGEDESIFLDGLEPILESGVTLAERLLRDWSGDRQKDLALLKRHCAFV